MKIKMLQDLQGEGVLLMKGNEYTVLSEYEDSYYIKLPGKKIGIDKNFEHDLFEVIK